MKTSWAELTAELEDCRKCRLCENRTRIVPGEGNPNAEIMFIGEGPGRDEDMQGRPFVGAAGQLLDKMLAAIHLSREDVYIANVVKCRPPGNRNPLPEEREACLNYLRWQTKLIHPKMIVCLGTVAAQAIIGPEARISKVRGQFIERKGYVITGTYHPAALLRDDRLKVDAWHDLQAIARRAAEWEDEDEG